MDKEQGRGPEAFGNERVLPPSPEVPATPLELPTEYSQEHFPRVALPHELAYGGLKAVFRKLGPVAIVGLAIQFIRGRGKQ